MGYIAKVTQKSVPISANRRLMAMLMDHLWMTGVGILFSLPYGIYMVVQILTGLVFKDEDMSASVIYKFCVTITIFGFSLYFSKDAFNGQSFAKRTMKWQVVNNKTGSVASPFQCFVRNLFCLIFPIEVIVAYRNPSRRIGDKVAGTNLVTLDGPPLQGKKQYGQAVGCVALGFALFFLYFEWITRL